MLAFVLQVSDTLSRLLNISYHPCAIAWCTLTNICALALLRSWDWAVASRLLKTDHSFWSTAWALLDCNVTLSDIVAAAIALEQQYRWDLIGDACVFDLTLATSDHACIGRACAICLQVVCLACRLLWKLSEHLSLKAAAALLNTEFILEATALVRADNQVVVYNSLRCSCIGRAVAAKLSNLFIVYSRCDVAALTWGERVTWLARWNECISILLNFNAATAFLDVGVVGRASTHWLVHGQVLNNCWCTVVLAIAVQTACTI